MKRVILFLFITIAFCAETKSQNLFEEKFQVNINNEFGYVSQLKTLNDSGYIFATTAYDNANNFILVGRLDKYGNTVWVKKIDDSFQLSQINFSISQTNFLFLTYSALNGSPKHYYSIVLKMDLSGGLIWSKCFGDSIRHESCEHIFLEKNSIFLAGEIYNVSVSNPSDLYLLKLDTAGNFQWGKHYDTGITDYLRDAIQLENGNILLSGRSDSLSRYFYASLFNIDTSGAIVWKKRFHLNSRKEFNAQAIYENSDGSLMISGHADTVDVANQIGFGLWDICVMKLNAQGNFQWGKIYGGSDFDEDWNIFQTRDKGFIVNAEPESFDSVSRIGLMKIDSIGNIQWMKLYGKNTGGFPDNLVINPDQGFTILATDGDYNVNAPMIFIKTDSLGNTKCFDSVVTLPSKSFIPIVDTIGMVGTLTGVSSYVPVITNYPLSPIEYCEKLFVNTVLDEKTVLLSPNPFTSEIKLNIEGNNFSEGNLRVENILGQVVYSMKLQKPSETIDLSMLPKGMYFAEITVNNKGITKKIVKQ